MGRGGDNRAAFRLIRVRPGQPAHPAVNVLSTPGAGGEADLPRRWTPTTATRGGHAAQCVSDGATPSRHARRRSALSMEQDLTPGSSRCHVPAALVRYRTLSRCVRRSTDGGRGCRAAADDSRVGLCGDSPQPHSPHATRSILPLSPLGDRSVDARDRDGTGSGRSSGTQFARTPSQEALSRTTHRVAAASPAYNVAMAKRDYGTGHLYVKQGSYFGRWRAPDGRLVNRKIGPVRAAGARGGGLTRVAGRTRAAADSRRRGTRAAARPRLGDPDCR